MPSYGSAGREEITEKSNLSIPEFFAAAASNNR